MRIYKILLNLVLKLEHKVVLQKDGSVISIKHNVDCQCNFEERAGRIEAIANDETIVTQEKGDSIIADRRVINNEEKEIKTKGPLKSAIENCDNLKDVWKDGRVNHEKGIFEKKLNEEIKYIGVNANVLMNPKPKHKHFAVFQNDAKEEIIQKTEPFVISAKTRDEKKRATITRSKTDKEMPKEFNKIMNSKSIEVLINGLAHEYEDVRDAAAIRLAELKDQRAIDYLSKCLQKDPSARVRKSCAMALGEIGGSRAISALFEASNDSYATVKERALKALQNIGGEYARDGISRFLRDKERNIRFSAVLAIKSIGGASSIEVLQRFLTYENDPTLRKLAIDYINEMRR